jgi:type IV secretory pathway ATPase VirB11/archaellum biosynthesis ATPase/intein/homing endonuclease
LKLGLGRRRQTPVEKEEQRRNYVVRFPFTGSPPPAGGKLLDRYPLINPYAYAAIIEDESGGRRYYLDEVPLAPAEARVYSYILDKLETELTIPRTEVDPKKYFAEQARRIVAKYGIKVSPIPWAKIVYFAERDLVGFGVLDAMLKDPNIEDISIDGIGKPLFVYHRRFESLGTNVVFSKDVELDNLITRLAHMAGKHISTAFPILQGTLPGRHRLMATFRREISPYGSTMTIRKFREDPLTIVDLLNSRVIDQRMAAYFWLLMENKSTALVVGSTGSGKTTLLNALLTLTRTNSKIVTIEEVQEVNIPHFNWTALLARENYGSGGETTSQVNLFDLVKAAMRMRPDIIVVGEVRGEEAYVLFQAISTGHGGMCLPGDEPLVARVDGTVKYLPIRDLVEAVEEGAAAEVVSFDPRSGEVGFARVTAVVNRRGTNSFLQVGLRHGRTIRVHDEHPLLVLRGGRLAQVPARDAKVGDLVPVPSAIPCAESVSELDVASLSRHAAAYARGVGLHAAPAAEGVLQGEQVRGPWSGVGGDGRAHACVATAFLEQAGAPPGCGHPLPLGPEDRDGVPAKMKLSRQFGRVLGWYAAAGRLVGRSRVVFRARTPSDARALASDLAASGVGADTVRVAEREEGRAEVSVRSPTFALVVGALGGGRDSYARRVPDIAFNAPRGFREGFVEGFLRGGRSAPGPSRGRPGAVAETPSLDLARSVHLLLKTMGVDSAIEARRPARAEGRPGDRPTRFGVRVLPGPGRGVRYEPIVRISPFHSDSRLYDIEVGGRGNFLHGASAFTHNCTVHADDVESAIQRLTSKPMDVPPAFIPFLDLTFTVRRISVPNPGGGFRAVRRIVSVDEVVKVGEYFNAFRWNPSSDTFKASELRSSPKLNRLAKDLGVQMSELTEELNKRAIVLRWLQERGVRNFREVSSVLEDYASRPTPVLQKAMKELGMAGTPEAIAAEGFKL